MTTDLLPSFGKYVYVQRLGEGGFGEVYRAVDSTLNRPVALKVPHRELLRDPGFVAQFRAEAQTAAQLDHPNIVRIYSVGEFEGTPFIEMELVEGQTLADLIKAKGRLTPEEALAIIEPVCAALEAAHRKGIIHRDIKPGNILIRASDGRVLVSDFGLAKARETSFQASLSSSNVVVGTFRYMPPEQANPKLGEIGPASDVYSLGVVLYEMLTGRVPFESKSVGQLIYQHTSEEPEPPSNININLSHAVESVILKALEKDVHGRFPSARSMSDALRAAIHEGVAVPISRPKESAEKPDAKSGRKSPLILLLSLLTVMILGIAIALVVISQSLRRGTVSLPHEPQTLSQTAQAMPSLAPRDSARATATAEAERSLTATRAYQATATAEVKRKCAALTPGSDPKPILSCIQSLPLVDQLRVPADGKTVSSKIELKWGKLYTIVAYGTIAHTSNGERADAIGPARSLLRLLSEDDLSLAAQFVGYAREAPYLLIDGVYLAPNLAFDLKENKYAWKFTGTGARLTFRIFDSGGFLIDPYSDNSGAIGVEIREGTLGD